MNNLRMSLWAALLKEIVHAEDWVMTDIPGFPFLPSPPNHGLKKKKKRERILYCKSAETVNYPSDFAMFFILLVINCYSYSSKKAFKHF